MSSTLRLSTLRLYDSRLGAFGRWARFRARFFALLLVFFGLVFEFFHFGPHPQVDDVAGQADEPLHEAKREPGDDAPRLGSVGQLVQPAERGLADTHAARRD